MKKNVLIIVLGTLLVGALVFIFLDQWSRAKVVPPAKTIETTNDTEGVVNKTTSNKKDTTKISEASIVGAWQSKDDPQSEITFTKDGEVVDIYGGGVIHETGNYQIFKSPSDLPEGVRAVADGPFLRETFGSDEYYYEIDELSDSSLVLIFISGKGNTLRYVRVGA